MPRKGKRRLRVKKGERWELFGVLCRGLWLMEVLMRKLDEFRGVLIERGDDDDVEFNN